MSREHILAKIRASLAKTRPIMEAEAARADHTPPEFVHPPAYDRTVQFVTELTQAGGRVHQCSNDTEARNTLWGLLQEHQTDTILAWHCSQIDMLGLDGLLREQDIKVLDPRITHSGAERIEKLQALEPVLVCVSGVDLAIAESGTLLLLSGVGRPRMASLLATVHIAVLRTSQIVRGLGEAFTVIQHKHSADVFRDHGNLTLITGPSRTADIELTLTIGVHGPSELHVLLIEG